MKKAREMQPRSCGYVEKLHSGHAPMLRKSAKLAEIVKRTAEGKDGW